MSLPRNFSTTLKKPHCQIRRPYAPFFQTGSLLSSNITNLSEKFGVGERFHQTVEPIFCFRGVLHGYSQYSSQHSHRIHSLLKGNRASAFTSIIMKESKPNAKKNQNFLFEGSPTSGTLIFFYSSNPYLTKKPYSTVSLEQILLTKVSLQRLRSLVVEFTTYINHAILDIQKYTASDAALYERHSL